MSKIKTTLLVLFAMQSAVFCQEPSPAPIIIQKSPFSPLPSNLAPITAPSATAAPVQGVATAPAQLAAAGLLGPTPAIASPELSEISPSLSPAGSSSNGSPSEAPAIGSPELSEILPSPDVSNESPHMSGTSPSPTGVPAPPTSSTYLGGKGGACRVGWANGESWSNSTAPGKFYVVYLKFSSGNEEELMVPWNLQVTSEAYTEIIQVWNWDQITSANSSYSGKVTQSWESLLGEGKNVVDIGFITYDASGNDENLLLAPASIKAGKVECEKYALDVK